MAIASVASPTAPGATAATAGAITKNPLFGATGTAPDAASALTSAQEQSDRFLKLLVTQMKNQDPLNPMDNAQITTQMAQISTVSGIDKLSATMATMNASILQMQSLEGALLVDKNVLVEGHQLWLDAKGNTSAGFELDSAAKAVVATIKDANGKVVETFELGALAAGRHSFDWTSADPLASGLRFEVSALNGQTAVGVTRFVSDHVNAVFTDKGLLTLELAVNGTVPYNKVKGVSN